MGLVVSLRPKRKKQRIQPSTDITESLPMDSNQSSGSTQQQQQLDPSEIYYTMIGYNRGPSIPVGNTILTSLHKDILERHKRLKDTQLRIECLQVLLQHLS